MGTMSDLGNEVADLGGKPVSSDMMQPLPQDMSVPATDMLTMPVDQGTSPVVDMMVAQDMTMADMRPVDQGMTSSVCGNNMLEPGELCDGNCPVSCEGSDVCTSDIRAGQDATCNVLCSFPVITACSTGDGCCPAGCDFAQDEDCIPPEMLDCANDATWPSSWEVVASQSRGEVNLTRNSGECRSLPYPSRLSLNHNTALTQAARCLAIWAKNNSNASRGQLISQMLIEVSNVGYSSDVHLLGGFGLTVADAQSEVLDSTQSCQAITSTNYDEIGAGYVDDTIGLTEHLVVVILGE